MRNFLHLLAAFAFAAPVLGADDALVFDQRYEGGRRYHQTVTTEQSMNMDLGDQKVDQRIAMSLGMLASVEDLPGGSGGKRVKITYDHAAMSQSAGAQKFSFDSKQPDSANAGPLAALGAIVGREFNVIFDSEGSVKEVENFEATMEKLSAGNPTTAKLYGQLFNKETVKRMMQQSALRSPAGKPVKAGDAWPFANELDMPGIGKLVVRGFYTFTGMVDHEGVKVAQVEAKADIQVEPGGGDNERTGNLINQMKMKIEEGTMAGTMYYDPAIHFTRDVQLTQTITLTAEIPDGTRKNLRLPMKQTIRMVLDDYGPIKAEKEEK